MLPQSDKASAFDALANQVQGCRLCPEMDGCTRVLSWSNGPPDAKLMFVGEAPGRLGADRTAVPFHGDKAGDNFERLLTLAGLRRADVFVTNAVLCNPRDDNGNNAPPSRQVLARCATNLRLQIEAVDPEIVVTLGAAALESVRLIEAHQLTLRNDVRTISEWFGRKIVPLYHPGARALIHRSFTLQTADYYFVGEQFRRLSRRQRQKGDRHRSGARGWPIVSYIMSRLHSVSLFRLHKALYLLDQRAAAATGETLTGFFYIRQKDGPYCVELGGGWHRHFDGIALRRSGGKLMLEWRGPALFESGPEVSSDDQIAVEELLNSITPLTDEQLKTRVYLTKPMRKALAAEKAGVSQLNRPLLT